MTYEDILNHTPLSTTAGNLTAAKAFADFLHTQIEGEGVSQLNDAQRNYLYKLRVRWRLRAAGKDARWMTYGSAPGRAKKAEQRQRANAKEEEVEYDELSARLINRFRAIRPDTGEE